MVAKSNDLKHLQRSIPVHNTRFGKPPGALPIALDFHIAGLAEPIRVPATRTIIIGRSDGDHHIRPDVDLSICDGYRKGVSRRHAIISNQDGYIVLIGLNSTNGTYINGQVISPGQATPIYHGDDLTFGGVTLHVAFVEGRKASRV